MPKIIKAGMRSHSFPDDATEDEIAHALAAMPEQPLQPVSQASVRRADNAMIERDAYAKMLKARGLPPNEVKMGLSVFTPADEHLAQEREDLTPFNFSSITGELKRAKHPAVVKALNDELERMKNLSEVLGVK